MNVPGIRSLLPHAIAAFGLVACLSLPAAAAGEPQAAPSDEEILIERASDYWTARVQRSGKVMTYYAPPDLGGPKRSRDVSEFGNVGYRSWKISGVEIEGDTALVLLEIEPSFPLPTPVNMPNKFKTRSFKERWIKVAGTWYKKPIPRGFGTRNTEPVDPSAPGPDAEGAEKAENAETTEAQVAPPAAP